MSFLRGNFNYINIYRIDKYINNGQKKYPGEDMAMRQIPFGAD